MKGLGITLLFAGVILDSRIAAPANESTGASITTYNPRISVFLTGGNNTLTGTNTFTNTTTLATTTVAGNLVLNGSLLYPVLSTTTASIGGGQIVTGKCATGTTFLAGALQTMVAEASPAASVDPSNNGNIGLAINAGVIATNTVEIYVCPMVTSTPATSTYNVRVLQ